MKTVKLGEVVDVVGGGTPRKSNADFYDGGIPWVTPKDMKTSRIGSSSVTLTPAGVAASPAKIVPAGSTLIVVRSGILKHTLPVALSTADVTLNQDMKALLPRGGLDAAYLTRFIQASEATILSWVRATTADNFPISKLLDLTLELPDLKEQRRIAAILDQADAVRAKRLRVLTHLNALRSSLFASHFGGTQYPMATLAEVSLGGGEYGAGVASREPAANLPRYVRITDITEAGELNQDAKAPAGRAQEWERYRLTDGDILLARSGATVGKSYRYRESDGPCIFAGYLIRFRPRRDLVDPDYLFEFTHTPSYRGWVRARQNVVAQPNINAKQYGSELSFPLPPIHEQEAFAAAVDKIRRHAEKVSTALAAGDELFASLQSRAFRGEL